MPAPRNERNRRNNSRYPSRFVTKGYCFAAILETFYADEAECVPHRATLLSMPSASPKVQTYINTAIPLYGSRRDLMLKVRETVCLTAKSRPRTAIAGSIHSLVFKSSTEHSRTKAFNWKLEKK